MRAFSYLRLGDAGLVAVEQRADGQPCRALLVALRRRSTKTPRLAMARAASRTRCSTVAARAGSTATTGKGAPHLQEELLLQHLDPLLVDLRVHARATSARHHASRPRAAGLDSNRLLPAQATPYLELLGQGAQVSHLDGHLRTGQGAHARNAPRCSACRSLQCKR